MLAPGNPRLANFLPEGGWPLGSLTEIQLPAYGQGEINMLMPALAMLAGERWIACINPPYLPYAPAWQAAGIDLSRLLLGRSLQGADAHWLAEQCLHSGLCGAVMLWSRLPAKAIRRLQLAAEAGQCAGIFWTPVGDPSPLTSLSLRICQGEVEILRGRGLALRRKLSLN